MTTAFAITTANRNDPIRISNVKKDDDTMNMAWIYLGLAAMFEVAFAMSMKYSEGFTKPLPTAITVIGVVGGITFLTLSMKTLPVSVAYPIWTAVGTLGTVILGFAFLGESLSALKIASAVAIVGGVAGLKIASA